MAKIAGFLAAFTALLAGVLAKVDPVACLGRAVAAFFIGMLGTKLWNGLFSSPAPKVTFRTASVEVHEEST